VPLDRLDRYVLREILGPTCVAFLAYTGFMLVRGLVQFSDLLVQSEQPLQDTGRVLAFSIPHIVVLTLPVAFLLGILIGVGRLSADSELIAFRAAGLDLARLYRPISVLGLVIFCATLFLMVAVVPATNQFLYTMKLNLSTFAIAQRIQPGVFSPEIAGIRIYVEGASQDRKSLTGLIVSDRSDPQNERLTLAQRGFLELEEDEGRLWLRVENAVTHHVQSDPRRYDQSSSADNRLLLVDTNPRGQARAGKQLREQTPSELLELARDPKRGAIERRMAWTEIHKKLALPSACLVFALVGLPLGVVTRRGGRAAGFAVSVAIVLAYYVLFAWGEARAIEGKLSPALSMWLPNILLLILGAVALDRVRKDHPLLPSWLPRLPLRDADQGKPLPETRAEDGSGGRPEPSRSMPFSPLLLDRYVAGHFLRIFSLVVLSVVALYVLIDYMEIADDIARHHPGGALIFRYYQAMLSPILLDIVPFAFLAAALIATAGLVRASETTALLAHGISLYRSAASLLLLAAGTGVVLFFFAERVVPRAAAESDRLLRAIKKHPEIRELGTGPQWFRGQSGRFFATEAFDPKTGGIAGLTVIELDLVTFRLRSRTDAPRARLVAKHGILAEDGWTRSFGPTGDSLFVMRPGRFFIDAPDAAADFVAGRSDPRQMTITQLSYFIEARRRAGADVAALATGLYQKTATPASALLLTLVGLPFAFRYGKRGAVAGIGLALLLGLTYFFVSSVLLKFGENGALPPFLAAWGTNVFFGLGAAYGLLGVRT
jgi:LPS export ABC transporter permease LptF/LPS export ABC transporter permease LptG